MHAQFITDRRVVADQLATRILNDIAFRNAMAHDPKAALQAAGFADPLSAPAAAGPESMSAQKCPYSCWNTTCTSMFSV